MTIREMHYDFKQKLNKIDSQQYRNLRVPEIDWKLNEAIELFIKIVSDPKFRTRLGFETSQRIIDDIRTLVVPSEILTLSPFTGDTQIATLPDEYMFYKGSRAILLKGECSLEAEKIYLRQHDDDSETSPFDNPSFEWREINIRFVDNGIRIFTGSDFTVSEFAIDYVRRHPLVHNAQDFPGGTYNALDGTSLSGSQDCILPTHTHREIVDLAVAITTGDLQISDYQIKRDKLNFNNFN